MKGKPNKRLPNGVSKSRFHPAGATSPFCEPHDIRKGGRKRRGKHKCYNKKKICVYMCVYICVYIWAAKC